ncbi:MAG TPA: phage holin family protein [Isosphaeraceae bacterium]|nr:phage holin family protein [Isosphaeraceae bacterium]
MAREPVQAELHDLASLVGAIAQDTERLLGQHAALLRCELRAGLRGAPAALATIGAGAGLIAAGGLLGSLMLVHGLHKSTRIPLWGCYGLVGGVLATVGGGLVVAGTRRTAALQVVPRETIAALSEDFQWLKDQVTRGTS